jgi:hypothetical protein
VNEAFGNFNMGMSIPQLEAMSIFYIPSPSTNRPLENKMLSDAVYKSAYTWEVCNLVAGDFDTTVLNPIIDSLANAIRPHVYADLKKFYTNQQFETNITTDITGSFNIPGLKKFLMNRRTNVLNELSANGCFMGTGELKGEASADVFPNPFTETTTLRMTNQRMTNYTLRIFDVFGKEVIVDLINNSETFVIHRGSLAGGIYFFRIFSETVPVASGKLVVE